MPTIKENITQWTDYAWSQQGDEWSQVWGGSEYVWWGSIYPRVRNFLPSGTVLEIAPGFGRMTQFLKEYCERLVVVDLTPRCIEACRERFRGEDHITFHVNDGRSLEMIPDRSVDFVFSFDSLVHAEQDVLRSYVHELSRKLVPEGIGFLHHSNLGAFSDHAMGDYHEPGPHWRARSMSAELFRTFCVEAGLRCIGQEIINWGGEILHDCFSLITPAGSGDGRPCPVWENSGFMAEAHGLGAVARHYGKASKSGTASRE